MFLIWFLAKFEWCLKSKHVAYSLVTLIKHVFLWENAISRTFSSVYRAAAYVYLYKKNAFFIYGSGVHVRIYEDKTRRINNKRWRSLGHGYTNYINEAFDKWRIVLEEL